MTLHEAQTLLETAPCSDEPSPVNPCLTQAQALEIIRKALPTLEWPRDKGPRGPNDPLGPIGEKRVWQVVRQQKRPRY